MSDILSVIVATAGHVDHGKTALVEALTGCNTDRLPQEKERGLSIDIGFARCQLTKEASVGIVDLPGHEDYIKNMAAGAASAKILLLIVAADESVMPQTKEHLQIISQLTNARIILVITKVDLVDDEYAQIVKEDSLCLLEEFGLIAEQIYYTSVKSMSGLSALREGINELALLCVDTQDERYFRVFIERTFIAKGHGIVVTGIGVSGKIRLGDTLILNGREVRVRGIECYGNKVEEAGSGQCLAINVDYNGSKVQRGMVLHHNSYSPSAELIVNITNISEDFTYNKVTKCRVHFGTLSCNASIKLFGCSELGRNMTAFAHLKLETESVISAGDKFLIRLASPFGSIGGGVVLSSDGSYRLSSKDKFRLPLFKLALDAVNADNYLLAELLAGAGCVFTRGDIERLGHFSSEVAQVIISEMVESKRLIMISSGVWLLSDKANIFARNFDSVLTSYHLENKYRLGMEREHVARLLGIPLNGVERAVKILGKYIKVGMSGSIVSRSDFEPELKGGALLLYSVISESVRLEPGLWLALGEVKDRCHVTNKETQEVIKILLSEGKIFLFSGKFIVSAKEVERLKQMLYSAFKKVDTLEIGYWREVTGLSRNHGVASLEYFDSINITRRVESGRVKIDN